ncbi:hypothetical protein ACFWJT_05150 [Streptomyces sp. NPDC127069]|uniref:hypothetical protein n=1 Tax=Streptomyces sp. NPDC127069 TaxID=3347128 RepID=UPI003652F806
MDTGYEATVYDHSGNEADCGHQRPVEVLRAWTEASEAAAEGLRRGAGIRPAGSVHGRGAVLALARLNGRQV